MDTGNHGRYQAVLLEGCTTLEEHYNCIQTVREVVADLHGEEGLAAMGLEYRVVPCEAHQTVEAPALSVDDNDDDDDEEEEAMEFSPESFSATRSASEPSLVPVSEITNSLRSTETAVLVEPEPLHDDIDHGNSHPPCHFCQRRLFHIKSNCMLDEENRKRFIADGEMYEDAARLCQETAQDIMREEAKLEWCTIEAPVVGGHREAIRVLVSSDHSITKDSISEEDKPTLLIATGRGKVRAGIFSRKHLMCDDLECATALPMVREATARNMNVLIVDPNVHGEANGFVTFQKTMDYYFEKSREKLYLLSHSASGGHMARYFLDRSLHLLTRIRAVAFTDSTHTIQWAKPENQHQELKEMLQSDRCVYFRCSNPRRDGPKWYVHAAGDPVQTDSFWKHRFGTIKTMWAGTEEHSMTNWAAHGKIWEHFDDILQSGDQE